jgi:hypothetical protein
MRSSSKGVIRSDYWSCHSGVVKSPREWEIEPSHIGYWSESPTKGAGLRICGLRARRSTGGSVLQVNECSVRCEPAAGPWEGILCHG